MPNWPGRQAVWQGQEEDRFFCPWLGEAPPSPALAALCPRGGLQQGAVPRAWLAGGLGSPKSPRTPKLCDLTCQGPALLVQCPPVQPSAPSPVAPVQPAAQVQHPQPIPVPPNQPSTPRSAQYHQSSPVPPAQLSPSQSIPLTPEQHPQSSPGPPNLAQCLQ